jgi:hypothetical protein
VDYLALTCRCVIGGVFLFAVLSKVRQRSAREAFLVAVSAFAPKLPSAPVGVAVAAAEFVIVLLVALPATAFAGLVFATGVLAVFSAVLWWALRRGVSATCQCFGVSEAPISRVQLVRNAALIGVALAGAVAQLAAPGVPLHPGGVAVSLGIAVVLVILVILADDLASLFSRSPTGGSERRR